jgi:hypothetical protein
LGLQQWINRSQQSALERGYKRTYHATVRPDWRAAQIVSAMKMPGIASHEVFEGRRGKMTV